jgi:hypothetical protein
VARVTFLLPDGVLDDENSISAALVADGRAVALEVGP